jgi:hypothetical protein
VVAVTEAVRESCSIKPETGNFHALAASYLLMSNASSRKGRNDGNVGDTLLVARRLKPSSS